MPLLKALTDRGINEVQANRLLRSLPADQPVADQLEYGDYLIWKSRATIKNAPGFYVYLLRQNILPPEEFETSSRKETRRANEERDAQEARRRILLEDEYHEYCRAKVQAHLKTRRRRGAEGDAGGEDADGSAAVGTFTGGDDRGACDAARWKATFGGS